MHASSDVAFTPAVKNLQSQRGSRHAYQQMEQRGGWATTVTPDLAAFIAEQDSFFLATANAQGQPYIQHRGGPKGFLRALDEHTLAFVNFAGNRQYISAGNLSENDRAFLFLIDYENRSRIKIWGRARLVERDAELLARLMPVAYKAKPDGVIVFEIEAWDANCRQHIPQLLHADRVADLLAGYRTRITELEAALAAATDNKQGQLPDNKASPAVD